MHRLLLKKAWRPLWLLALLCCVWGLAYAGGADNRVVLLEPQAHGQSLQGHIGVWIDERGTATWDDVRHPAMAERWLYPVGPVRTGTNQHPHWLKVQLEQRSLHHDWLLALPTTAIQDLRIFGPFNEQGQALADTVVTGLQHPYSTRPLGSERYVTQLSLPQTGVYILYLRAQSDTSQNLTLTAWNTTDYFRWRQDKRLFDGICYGILLALLVYNLVLASVFRDRTYALYVAVGLFALFTLSTYNGHAARYLWPDWPWLIEHSYVLMASLWIGTNSAFAADFLNTRRQAPKLHRVIQWITGMAVLALAVGLAGHVRWAQTINEVLGVAGSVLMAGSTTWIWRRGFGPAGWYLAGQLTLFGAVIATVLVNWGLLDAPFLLANGLQLGVALEMVVFAVALSARIRLLQREQLELHLRAQHLAEMAETDPLTGIANRNGLVHRTDKLLAQAGHHVVLLLDLDKFKPVNDTLGHEAGDAVLVTVARRLASQLRDSDVVARLGGDEFVIVLSGKHHPAPLDSTVQRLVEAVNQPLLYNGHHIDIQSSIGAATSPQDGSNLKALLAAADKAMYRAKQERNHIARYNPSRDFTGHGGKATDFGALN
jgi:diguanylate cyclase (GGDEF)-like protein